MKAILAKRSADGELKVFPRLKTYAILRGQWEYLRAKLGKDDDAGFIPHVLRHTCASRMMAEGVPVNAVQAWMGHSSIQTTMRYAHLQTGQLSAAAVLMANRKTELEQTA